MPRILVVDDNEDNRDSLSRRLMRKGFDVITAADGSEAIHQADDGAPDLILMDMNMPVLDGWEATRQLRSKPEFAELPIIALTAYALTGDREKALESGCTDYHTKPINFEALLAQIEIALNSRSQS